MAEVRFGESAEEPAFVVATSDCHAMPGGGLGNGTDLAYCLLAEPVTTVEPARVLAGCERESLVEGAPVTMVGFGAEGPDGESGKKRAGSSVVAALGSELLLDGEGVDTCDGDSGGPLFLSIEQPDGSVAQRLVGITSAGSASECGSGVSHYVNLTEQLEWLEDSSGIDVTPCFDGEDWAPTPGCVSLVGMEPDEDDGSGACRLAAEPEPLSTCGEPSSFESDDEEEPSLELGLPLNKDIVHVLEPDEEYLEFEVSAEAEDGGWGVEEVRFSLLDAAGDIKVERVDQVPPYGIPTLRIPEGSFTFVAEATDRAGNTSVREVAIDVSSFESTQPKAASSCQLTRAPTGAASTLVLLLPLLLRRLPLRKSDGRETARRRRERV